MNTKPEPKTLDNLQVGDVITSDPNYERTVLGVCGGVIHVSDQNDETVYDQSFTVEELVNYGYTVKQDEPEEESYHHVEVVGHGFSVKHIEINGKTYRIADIISKVEEV